MSVSFSRERFWEVYHLTKLNKFETRHVSTLIKLSVSFRLIELQSCNLPNGWRILTTATIS